MAPSTDHLLQHYSGTAGNLSLALVLANAVLLSIVLLVYCSFCRRKSANITGKDIKRERQQSELKKVVKIENSNGATNGVIPAGSEKITKSENHKSKNPETEKNGSAVKDGGEVSLEVTRRILPLPPVSDDPPDPEDPLYDCVNEEQTPAYQIGPGPNEKQMAHTSGSNLTMAVMGNGAANPELVENINPLYTSVEEAWKKDAPGTQKSMVDLSSPKPNEETPKEPVCSSPPADEPIYSIVRKDKQSIKKPPVIKPENRSEDSGVELEDSEGDSNHKNSDSPAAPVNPGSTPQVPRTSSVMLTEMIKRCESRRLKNSSPKETVIHIIDLEKPPPVPDKLFDIRLEVGSEELHAHEDNTGADIGPEL